MFFSTVLITIGFKGGLHLWNNARLLWSIRIVLLWEIFDCLLRYICSHFLYYFFARRKLCQSLYSTLKWCKSNEFFFGKQRCI